MTRERPLLLLDVDGVLCPLGDRGREPLVDHGVVGHTYLRYSVHTAERLRHLSTMFRLVWATSWEDEANDVIAPLFDLPPLPVVYFNDDAHEGESWKLPAIRDYVGARPFAYVDDDIGNDAIAWAKAREVPTLMLAIRGDSGLLAPDIEELERFAPRREMYADCIRLGVVWVLGACSGPNGAPNAGRAVA